MSEARKMVCIEDDFDLTDIFHLQIVVAHPLAMLSQDGDKKFGILFSKNAFTPS